MLLQTSHHTTLVNQCYCLLENARFLGRDSRVEYVGCSVPPKLLENVSFGFVDVFYFLVVPFKLQSFLAVALNTGYEGALKQETASVLIESSNVLIDDRRQNQGGRHFIQVSIVGYGECLEQVLVRVVGEVFQAW